MESLPPIKLFNRDDKFREPFQESFILRYPPPPGIDPKQRIAELQVILELEQDKDQKINIEAVIAMYRDGTLPDPAKRFIELQDGIIVDRPKPGKKSWAEDIPYVNLIMNHGLV